MFAQSKAQNLTHRFLLSTSALSLLIGVAFVGTAHAQSAPSNASQTTGQNGNQIEQVIVTAERRSQRLIDVPAAVDGTGGSSRAADAVVDEIKSAGAPRSPTARPLRTMRVSRISSNRRSTHSDASIFLSPMRAPCGTKVFPKWSWKISKPWWLST